LQGLDVDYASGDAFEQLVQTLGRYYFSRVAISKPKNSKNDLTHICRLGHMSEQAIVELHKRKLLKNLMSYKLNFYKYCVIGKETKVSFKITEKEN